MHSQEQAVNAAPCRQCPERLVSDSAGVSVSALSVVPSRLAAQGTDGVWNAVVTTHGKGTFLIRCAPNLPADTCPLRAYDVRWFPAASQSDPQEKEWDAPLSARTECPGDSVGLESK